MESTIELQLLVFSILLSLTVILSIRYIRSCWQYWEKQNVPFVSPWTLLFDSMSKTLKECERDYHGKHGDIFGYYEYFWPVISIKDSELLKDILIKDFDVFTNRRKMETGSKGFNNILPFLEDDDWRSVRSLTSSGLTPAKLKKISKVFIEVAEGLANDFLELSRKGEPVELTELFGLAKFDESLQIHFSYKVADPKNNWSKDLHRRLLNTFHRDISHLLIGFDLRFPTLSRPFEHMIFSRNLNRYVKDFCNPIFSYRDSLKEKPDDIFQAIASANTDDSRDGISSRAKGYSSQITIKDNNVSNSEPILPNPSYSRNFLECQCISLITTSMITTTASLASAAYELAVHPDWQEKLIEEVDSMFKETEGVMDYARIKKLRLMKCFLYEVFRLHPLLSRFERLCGKDYKLGNTGIVIPKGMIVSIPIAVILQDEDFFPDPEKFDPERYFPENKSEINSCTYLAFGDGPRMCPGKGYAFGSLMTSLAAILRRVRFRVAPETKIPLQKFDMIFLAPKHFYLLVEERNDVLQNGNVS